MAFLSGFFTNFLGRRGGANSYRNGGSAGGGRSGNEAGIRDDCAFYVHRDDDCSGLGAGCSCNDNYGASLSLWNE